MYLIINNLYIELKEVLSYYWHTYKPDIIFGASQTLSLNIALNDFGLIAGNIKSIIELGLLASTAVATTIYAWYRVVKAINNSKNEKEKGVLIEISKQIKEAEFKRVQEQLRHEKEENRIEELTRVEEQTLFKQSIKEIREGTAEINSQYKKDVQEMKDSINSINKM